ncbi:MAG: aminotransferase class V-fold PLP-dependent enzyme [Clostridiales bacterium]|nr:aminotransferase class V-fold PLP-dependent enzyme [Clostridiales bacterium]
MDFRKLSKARQKYNERKEEKSLEMNTMLLHSARQEQDFMGSSSVPIFQTSAFAHKTAEDLENIFNNKKAGFAYSRLGNPTVNNFEKRIARLEDGISATACSSGSAAVTCTLLNILKSGDEIIAPTGLYGGTLDLLHDLKAFGIKTVYVNDFTYDNIAAVINNNTKVIFAELIGNPKLNVIDVNEIASLAHRNDIPLVVDSTTATPVLAKPIKLGADIVIHSSSKYINSNGSAISGVIVDGGNFKWNKEKFSVMGDYLKFGKGAFTARLRNSVWRNIGACLAPLNAYLNINGLETLGIRMERICTNAQRLAEHFKTLRYVKEVNYPGLKDNPYYPLIQKQFTHGYAGGIITIRVESKEKAFSVINHLKYALNISNIGDTKTLVVHPASTIFAHSSQEEKEAAGVYDDLIRISVGIEDIEDIIADFDNAFFTADMMEILYAGADI